MSREDFLERRRLQKQRATLAAARAHFAAHGLEGASVERIAQEAAVSTATLYRYFPSKLALFEAVLRDGLIEFEAALGRQTGLALWEQVNGLAHAYAVLLNDPLNAGMLRTVFSAAASSPEITAIFYERVKRVVAEAFHAAVERARAGGALKPDVHVRRASGQLMGMIEHATLWRRLLLHESPEDPPETIAAGALDVFWTAHGRAGT